MRSLMKTNHPSLIIALDDDDQRSALALVDALDPLQCALKVGSEMYTRFGAPWVKTLMARQFNVFLDLKFHDIPRTVSRAVSACADLGVWMVNVHASGGEKMMCAAKEALESFGAQRPLLMAVTVLTSLNDASLVSVGLHDTVSTHVLRLARLAQNAGCDGVVSSAQEVRLIKQACSEAFLTVTPGIRFAGDPVDDQARIVTPQMAWDAGSDYLVMGRPITQASNPAQLIQDLLRYEH